MNQELKEILVLIQNTAEEAITTIKTDKIHFSGVNYGDLHVADVYAKQSIHDDVEYWVLIEECSPTAHDFQEYIGEFLIKKLPSNLHVFVETDW